MAAARFRFRSAHPGLSLIGRGWHAQFEGGRFATNDERTAVGIARRALQNPDYGIQFIRGSEKPDPAPPPTGEAGEG